MPERERGRQRIHAFEFMDIASLPQGLRDTLREILECGNSSPFRGYYAWVEDQVVARCAAEGLTQIVELGAGTAPITRRLLRNAACADLSFVVCDAHPDRVAYARLE